MTRLDPRATDLPYLKKLKWPTPDRFLIERKMIQSGGKLHGHGEGIAYHYKAAICALWPTFDWHRWSHLLIEEFAENMETAVMGPASSGKTYCASAFGLVSFWVFNPGISIIMSSTTKEGLQLRIWGSIKELFNKAKNRRSYLTGRLIESRYMLTGASSDDEAQDFRDGIIGVACRVGGTFVGISNYVGLKNEHIMLIGDELSLMNRGFIDSLANLRKGAKKNFKFIGMGNPSDPTDALGVMAEPAAELGGWTAYEGTANTRTWKTRAVGGKCVQLCGYDSPNYDYPRGLNPFKGLITPEQIENDLAYYGENSLQFYMMNLGVMPRNPSARRVITKLLAEQRQAFDSPIWGSSKLVRITGLDPAYGGVGGDRCVLTDLIFGPDRDGKTLIAFDGQQTMVPIDATSREQAEEQIVRFCMRHCIARGVDPDNFGLDATMAGSLVSTFAQIWSPSVVPVMFGGPAPDRLIRSGDPKKECDAYGKMVSAIWWASRYIIDAAQLRSAPVEAIEEASLREWGINKLQSSRKSDPVVDVEPKDKMKLRSGRSPDLWDSACVAIEVARRRGFVIGGGPALALSARKAPEWAVNMLKRRKLLVNSQSLTYA